MNDRTLETHAAELRQRATECDCGICEACKFAENEKQSSKTQLTRYAVFHDSCGEESPMETDDGAWVRYDDAQAEIERLQRECANWKQLHEVDEACIGKQHAKFCNLRERLKDVVAECDRAAPETPELRGIEAAFSTEAMTARDERQGLSEKTAVTHAMRTNSSIETVCKLCGQPLLHENHTFDPRISEKTEPVRTPCDDCKDDRNRLRELLEQCRDFLYDDSGTPIAPMELREAVRVAVKAAESAK